MTTEKTTSTNDCMWDVVESHIKMKIFIKIGNKWNKLVNNNEHSVIYFGDNVEKMSLKGSVNIRHQFP